MNKEYLRTLYKQKRAQLSAEERDDFSLKIANNALKMPIWDKEFYHIFLPIQRLNEVNTEYMLNILSGKDKNTVISKTIVKTNQLKHFLLTDNTVLSLNSLGIPEPQNGIRIKEEHLDVVFVPLLCVDIEGNRLGYGKGFYDAFLSKCKPDCLKIGLSFFEPVEKILVNSHDVALNACITVDKIHLF